MSLKKIALLLVSRIVYLFLLGFDQGITSFKDNMRRSIESELSISTITTGRFYVPVYVHSFFVSRSTGDYVPTPLFKLRFND